MKIPIEPKDEGAYMKGGEWPRKMEDIDNQCLVIHCPHASHEATVFCKAHGDAWGAANTSARQVKTRSAWFKKQCPSCRTYEMIRVENV